MKTIDEHITNVNDDVEQDVATGAITYNNRFLNWAQIYIAGGFIFKDIKILKLCEIISAKLYIYHVGWTIRGIVNVVVEGWLICGILNWQFPPFNQTPTGCPKTVASRNIPYTGTKAVLEDFCRHEVEVDVTAIVQELVNQEDWRKKHDIAFTLSLDPLIRGTYIKMCMRDHSELSSPRLVVELKPRVLLNEANAFQSPVY